MAQRRSPPAQHQSEIRVGDRGRIVLPAAVRKNLNLRKGSRLVVIQDQEGELRLISLRSQAGKCAGLFRELAPRGASPSKELLEERRREAKREQNA